MFQFRKEDSALQAAKVLAVREAAPILVMVPLNAEVYSIGPRHSAALREAGRHVATVHWSGRVDYMGI
jgi:hypothetical protein